MLQKMGLRANCGQVVASLLLVATLVALLAQVTYWLRHSQGPGIRTPKPSIRSPGPSLQAPSPSLQVEDPRLGAPDSSPQAPGSSLNSPSPSPSIRPNPQPLGPKEPQDPVPKRKAEKPVPKSPKPSSQAPGKAKAASKKRPNILFILADDLGERLDCTCSL